MANIQRLREELINDPLARGYASMTDQNAADDLNTEYRQHFAEITSRQLLIWAAGNGRLKKIDAARLNVNVPAAIQNVCEAAMRLIDMDSASLNPGDQSQMGMLDALVSAGIITQTDADELLIRGTKTQSRAQELNLLGRSPEIGPAHIAKARAE